MEEFVRKAVGSQIMQRYSIHGIIEKKLMRLLDIAYFIIICQKVFKIILAVISDFRICYINPWPVSSLLNWS
jgi:hypothetical protein